MNISPELDPTAASRIDQAFVIGQLGQTLDGRIACWNGVSKYINGSDALDHLHAMRADVDAVLVGVGTVLADNPRLTVRRCSGRTPRAVIIDPRRRTPPDAAIFTVGDEPPLFIRRADDVQGPEDIGTEDLPDAPGSIDPAAIVAALCARGLCRILVEGGASTLSRFIDSRAMDELHILMAPIILGSGVNGLNLKPIDGLDHALRPEVTLSRFPDGDVLYRCRLKSVWAR